MIAGFDLANSNRFSISVYYFSFQSHQLCMIWSAEHTWLNTITNTTHRKCSNVTPSYACHYFNRFTQHFHNSHFLLKDVQRVCLTAWEFLLFSFFFPPILVLVMTLHTRLTLIHIVLFWKLQHAQQRTRVLSTLLHILLRGLTALVGKNRSQICDARVWGAQIRKWMTA